MDTTSTRWLKLVETVEALGMAATAPDVIRIIRNEGRLVAEADGVTFVMREGEFCHYVDENAIGPLWKGQKFPLRTCISGWSMNNGLQAAIEDILADERIPQEAYRPTFVKSLLMTPVMERAHQGKAGAAIGAYWTRKQPIPEETKVMMTTLARATAVALKRVGKPRKLARVKEGLSSLWSSGQAQG